VQERRLRLDRKRRIHLGILRSELLGRPYERFFRWEMDPLPEHVLLALERGEASADEALPRADAERLLEPGYLPLETGYARHPDGTLVVSVLTHFPGASGEMIDWWFGWHGAETERYKLWHPQAHLFCQMRHPRSEMAGLGDRDKYVGNTAYVDEYIGPVINRLAIRFRPPGDLGLDERAFDQAAVGTAVCARVGFSDRPIDAGHLIHLIRETPGGCEMRSRFWLGETRLRWLPEDNPIDRLLRRRAMRTRMLPSRMGRALLVHCAEEMNHLASFLPALYEQESDRARRPA